MATHSLEYKPSKTLSERAIALFDSVPIYIKTFGWRGLLCFGLARYSSSRKPAPMFFRNNSKPTWVRPDSSDLLTMREVFLDRDYDFPVRDNVKFIVDAGANIGLASIFFANKYPDAKIIAIEPEKENFLLLKRNAEPYSQIIPVNAALWRSSGSIRLVDPGRGEHGFTTVEGSNADGSNPEDDGDELVASLSMDDLMKTYGIAHIDLLKVDIEGSEKELFEAADGWIDRVSVIVIELHERFKPGCVESFARATRHMNTMLERGKLVVKAVSSR
jgi:hypothetical protein